jgi:hypothetical protein
MLETERRYTQPFYLSKSNLLADLWPFVWLSPDTSTFSSVVSFGEEPLCRFHKFAIGCPRNSISMLHVHTNAACPCCMYMSKLLVHAMLQVLVPATCPCPCCNSRPMLRVHVHMLHVNVHILHVRVHMSVMTMFLYT